MTKTPTFLRREPSPGHANLETGVRDIIAKLQANADREAAEILAGGVNLYLAACLRFRGNNAFTAGDITQLFGIWQILLDVKRPPEQEFAAGMDRVEPLQPDRED